MQLKHPNIDTTCSELSVMQDMLCLENAHVLELGCGAAQTITTLVNKFGVGQAIAAEVDQRAHQANLDRIDTPDNLTFANFGAEQIDAEDNLFDIVIMLKSLHHVPDDSLAVALQEIHRVLKPGGMAYISEPVFAGSLNEVIRLFHDEEQVRYRAHQTLVESVQSGLFELVEERFFYNPVKLESFAQFKRGIIDATHSEHNLSADLLSEVQAKFESYRENRSQENEASQYNFLTPNRVDLLQKPNS